MLSSPCLRNNPRLPNPFREQRLTDSVIDLMSTGMRQIFPLQPNIRPARHLRQSRGEVKRCRPPYEIPPVLINLSYKIFIILYLRVLLLNLAKGFRQRLGDVLPAKLSKPRIHFFRGVGIRHTTERRRLILRIRRLLQTRHQLRRFRLHCRRFLRGGCIGANLIQALQNGAPHNNAIANLTHFVHHGGSRNTETHRQWKFRRGAHPRNELG
mmetsp:Transcript_39760/g.48435  ORF Transcript_39760/g.48435 Transcript_39760/m.48435 type:complete len:211 (-) Transcript_39760:945-1577(-)